MRDCIHAPVPNLSYIHLTEDEIDEMIDVMACSRGSLPLERRMTREEAMIYTFRDPDFDPKATWLVSSDGKPVGFGAGAVDSNRLSAGKNDGRFEMDVIPDFRGLGIENELLTRSLGYFRSKGLDAALSRVPIEDKWKISFLESNDFTEYYRIFDLVRSGTEDIGSPTLPEGFVLQHGLFAEHSDAEIESWVEAFNDSFMDHVNFAPEMPQRFINWRNWAGDPMLLSTIRKDSSIVGVCLCEESSLYNKERGRKVGWINIVGVVPQFRRLGLARAMLADGISWLVGRGMDTLYIGVVSENEKALDLYLSLGFKKEHESMWMKRPVVLESAVKDS